MNTIQECGLRPSFSQVTSARRTPG